MSDIQGAIWSLKRRVTIDGETMNLFDARDRGLVEVNRDLIWNYYSYRVISTGEVVSFYNYMHPSGWSDWYREAITKRDQQRADEEQRQQQNDMETHQP